MKGIRKSIKALLWAFVIMFTVLAGYTAYTVTVNGSTRFISSYNPRLANQKQNVVAGSILDRNYTVLAESQTAGEREYHPDSVTRKAVSHVVGDPYGLAATGVESFHAKYLLGFGGNVFERLYQSIVLHQRKGENVTTTIDAQLCKYAYQQLDGKNGAVVVMNYRTGEILCSVSTPGYDPTNMDAYRDLSDDDPASPLVNRVTMGRYTPGSVFKTITLAAVVKYQPELLAKTYSCAGSMDMDDSAITCAGKSRHGDQTVLEAYENSCNVAFAQIALDLGRDNVMKMAQEFGFNEEYLFSDLIAYKSSYETSDKDLDFCWSAIGQYKDTSTPLQMCMVAATIANDGIMMEPKLVKSIINARGYEYNKITPKTLKTVMSPENAQVIREYMISAVTDGLGGRAAVSGYTVGGKTGSAEVSDDKSVPTHAWYNGFIYDDKSPLAIAVIVEHGGSGGRTAAPIAGAVLKKAVELGY